MALIEWSEEYCIGLPEVDEQHKEWVNIINSLHESLLVEQGEQLGLLTSKSLMAMQSYCEMHFKFEENYMEEIGYPDFAEHKALHKNFLENIIELFDKHTSSEAILLNTQLMKILKNWLVQHILEEDSRIQAYAVQKM